MSFLKAQVSFPSNFASIISAIKHQFSVLFLAQVLYALVKSSPLKWTFSRFSSAWTKICPIPYVSFELTSQFLFKFCIVLHCHNISWQLPCKFLANTISSKSQFLDLVLRWKIAKFFMSFLEAEVSFLSNSVSILSAFKHNSSILSKLKHDILWSKAVH